MFMKNQLKQKKTLFCFLCLLYAPASVFGYDFGCYTNPDVYWDTPGHHYIPDRRMPVYFGMTVFSTTDILVKSGGGWIKEYSGHDTLIPSKWTVAAAGSSLHGTLEVTGEKSQYFPLQGTQGEQITILCLVVPEEGYTWPKAYRLEGVASGFQEGSQVQLSVGTWFKIQDPHRSFNLTAKVPCIPGCGNVPKPPNPSWSPPYGDEKWYDAPNYAPWVDKGDMIIIEVPENITSYGTMPWASVGWCERWNGIPVEGIGDSVFYTRGGAIGNYEPSWTYPENYIPCQQYADVVIIGHPYPYPCLTYHTTDGLSFGSLCGRICTMDGKSYPLDDGVDESGTGLYGPGFIGRRFAGPSPASGFLHLYLNMGTMPSGFTLNEANVTVNIIDNNNDSIVDTADLGSLCGTWLSTESNEISNYTDLDNDGTVNYSDFALIANLWLEGFELPIAGETVFVEGGSFPYQHNTPNEQSVNVPSFYSSKYEVTNDQYCQFLNVTDPCGTHYYYEQAEIIRHGTEGFYTYKVQTGKEKHPVRNINFYDASAYAQWVSDITGQTWRLPVETEWEKAAAWNPNSQRYYLYGYQQDVINCNWCNTLGCVGDETPAGYYNGTDGRNNAVSFYGCYDMTGNLWEFTTKPGTGECVIRGGSWGNNTDQAKNNYRWEYTPTNYSWYIGIRLVRETGGGY